MVPKLGASLLLRWRSSSLRNIFKEIVFHFEIHATKLPVLKLDVYSVLVLVYNRTRSEADVMLKKMSRSNVLLVSIVQRHSGKQLVF